MNFDNYDPKNLPPLRPEDEKKPLAYIYYQGRHELTDQDQIDAIKPDNALAPEDICTLEEICRMLLDKEECRKGPKMGYGLTPEGYGYACINTDMPGLTMEVRDFHMKWVGEDPGFHYKLWYPGAHIIHYDKMAIEDCGWGIMDLLQGGRPPMSDVGLPENYSEINPYICRVMGRNARGRLETEEFDLKSGYSGVLHCVMDGGLHQWSFGFMGAHYKNGKLVDMRNDYEKEHPEWMLYMARQMTSHFLHENKQLSYLMQMLYPKYGGKIEPYALPHVPKWFASHVEEEYV
jgi:hypothetical protein